MKVLAMVTLASAVLVPASSDGHIPEEPRCSGTAPAEYSCALDLLIEQDHPAIFLLAPSIGAISATLTTDDLSYRESALCARSSTASYCDSPSGGGLLAGDVVRIRVETAGTGPWAINVIYDLGERFPCRQHLYGCEYRARPRVPQADTR